MRPRAVVRDDGRRYGSIADVARDICIGRNVNSVSRNIIQACQGRASHAYGHRWRYEDGEFPAVKPKARREPAPTGMCGIAGMHLSHEEWGTFKRMCGERELLAREAGAEAIRMWIGNAEG